MHVLINKIYAYAGKLSVEGEIVKKFDMNPNSEHLKDYAKLCRDRMEESASKKVKVSNSLFFPWTK